VCIYKHIIAYTQCILICINHRGWKETIQRVERDRDMESYICISVCIYTYIIDTICIDMHKTQRVERDRDMESYICISVCICIYIYDSIYTKYIDMHKTQRVERDRDMEHGAQRSERVSAPRRKDRGWGWRITHTHTHAHTRTHTHTHTYTYTYTHTHTHTHIHTLAHSHTRRVCVNMRGCVWIHVVALEKAPTKR
jgi:hypothetical protein